MCACEDVYVCVEMSCDSTRVHTAPFVEYEGNKFGVVREY